MKILTPRNNKDYYDYLTGIYGVDEKIVFDRRKFTILSRLNHPLFTSEFLEKDAPKKERPLWQWEDKRIPEYEGTKFKCLLEVGLKSLTHSLTYSLWLNMKISRPQRRVLGQ